VLRQWVKLATLLVGKKFLVKISYQAGKIFRHFCSTGTSESTRTAQSASITISRRLASVHHDVKIAALYVELTGKKFGCALK
jgi:hypothetical protein